MRRGEIWWVEFDPSVGSEIRKTRPAVIVSNDAVNRNLTRIVVIPLTINTGRQFPGEAIVSVGGQSSKAMADQIMVADKSRLKSQLGALPKSDMLAVEDAIEVSPLRNLKRLLLNNSSILRKVLFPRLTAYPANR